MPHKRDAINDYPDGADRGLLKRLQRKAQAERAQLFRTSHQQVQREARLAARAMSAAAKGLPVLDRRLRDTILTDWSKAQKEVRAQRLIDGTYHGQDLVAHYLGCRVAPFPSSFVHWTTSPAATANRKTGLISWKSNGNQESGGSLHVETIWAGFEVWCYTPGRVGTLVCSARATGSAGVFLNSWQPGGRASVGLAFRGAIQVGIPPLDVDADIYPYTAMTIGSDTRLIGPRTYEVTVKYPLGNTFYPGGANPYRRFWCGLVGHCSTDGLAVASAECYLRVEEMCWHVE